MQKYRSWFTKLYINKKCKGWDMNWAILHKSSIAYIVHRFLYISFESAVHKKLRLLLWHHKINNMLLTLCFLTYIAKWTTSLAHLFLAVLSSYAPNPIVSQPNLTISSSQLVPFCHKQSNTILHVFKYHQPTIIFGNNYLKWVRVKINPFWSKKCLIPNL